MKKTLIALAVAGTFAAPAFAATSNVDVYGLLHVSVNRIDFDQAGVDNSTSVTSNASRIGFKGTEDLGGGLAAIWQIESGFEADEKNNDKSEIGGRNTFVGLKGGFGTVLLGKHDTPMKAVGRLFDAFGDTLADSRNLLGANNSATSMFDLRTPNTIAYVSPSFSGLTMTAAYVTDWNSNGTSADDNTTDAYSLNGVYNNGPIMLAAAYEKQNAVSLATDDQSMWRLVGGYSFGNAKVGALYEKSSSDVLDNERKAWGVFANYAMGAITLKANYMKVGDNEAGNDTGAKQFTLGADYALSKRTTAYAYYTRLNNNANAAFDLGRAASASDMTSTNNGDDPSAFGIGMKHSF